MMKPSSGKRTCLKVFASIVVIVVALGFYGQLRAQSGTGAVKVPLRPLAPLSTVQVPPIFGIEGILADKTAAIQLGKALFWDMQAGSDDIQACASCHFNAGADSRAANQVNPGQAGNDNTFQIGNPNHHYNPGSPKAGFGGYHDGDFPFHKVSDPKDRFSLISDVNDVSGSQGVFAASIVGVSLISPNGGFGAGGALGDTGVGQDVTPGMDGDVGLTCGGDASSRADLPSLRRKLRPQLPQSGC